MKKIGPLMLAGVLMFGCGSPQQDVSSSKTVPVQQEALPQKISSDYISDGLKYLKGEDPLKAIESFDQAIKENPLDPQGYLILGQTYMRLTDFNRAIDSFTAGTRVAPEMGELFYLLAISHGLAGNREMAKENVQKSIEIFHEEQDEDNFKKSLALLHSFLASEE